MLVDSATLRVVASSDGVVEGSCLMRLLGVTTSRLTFFFRSPAILCPSLLTSLLLLLSHNFASAFQLKSEEAKNVGEILEILPAFRRLADIHATGWREAGLAGACEEGGDGRGKGHVELPRLDVGLAVRQVNCRVFRHNRNSGRSDEWGRITVRSPYTMNTRKDPFNAINSDALYAYALFASVAIVI